MSEHYGKCCCTGGKHVSVTQTLDELEFERGLWYAALTGDLKRVELLLSKGKDPSMPDNSGYTALHYASRSGHLKICKVLLEAGACVNAITKSCQSTPLHRAAYCGRIDIVKLLTEQPQCLILLQDVDGKTCLHKAVESKHWGVMEHLARHEPHLLDICDEKGRRPFHYVDDPVMLQNVREKLNANEN